MVVSGAEWSNFCSHWTRCQLKVKKAIWYCLSMRWTSNASQILSGLFPPSPWLIQDLIEKVMVLSRSIEMLRGTAGQAPGPVLAERITQYASLLASQGCLAAAMNYLPSSSKEVSEKWVVVGKSSIWGKMILCTRESLGFDMHQDLRFHLNYGNLRVEVWGFFFWDTAFVFICFVFVVP